MLAQHGWEPGFRRHRISVMARSRPRNFGRIWPSGRCAPIRSGKNPASYLGRPEDAPTLRQN